MVFVEQKEKMFLVETLNVANPGDIRGPIREWKFPDGYQITVIVRREGEKFGGHYHGGNDKSKNPEMISVIKGRARFQFADLGSKKKQEVIVKEGDVITIWPGVVHWGEVLEKLYLIEFRTTHFDPEHPDTYPV